MSFVCAPTVKRQDLYGSLDLPDDILAKLDVRICSIHSYFGLSRKKQTERIIRAMDNPNFNIMAHPTGRRIGERKAYEVDMEHIMEAAMERGCFLEINAQPLADLRSLLGR
jgi:DNA polymerase (family 10)